MLHPVAIGEIENRAKAIGLNLKQLAHIAGVSPSTAYRASEGDTDPRFSTLRKLAAALEHREAEMRAHLAGLSAPERAP